MYWKIPIHLQNLPIKSHCFLLSKMESLIMFPSSCSTWGEEARVKAMSACIFKKTPSHLKKGNLKPVTALFCFFFLMMMWYKYVNKTRVKAGFCLHRSIHSIVCSPMLMQTQTLAPIVYENAKELTEKQSGKDWSHTHCPSCCKNNVKTVNKKMKNPNIFEPLLF